MSSEPTLVPLVYANRSGSTLLARFLAERVADVVVVPECRWAELLLVTGEERLERMDGRALMELMQLDSRIVEVFGGLDEARRFAERYAGAPARDLLVETGRWLGRRQGKEARYIVVKHGELLRYLPLFPERLGRMRLLHVFRDPRGVAALRPAGGRSAVTPGVAAYKALGWRRIVRQVHGARERGICPVDEVRYETLVVEPERALAQVAERWGVRVVEQPPESWVYQVPSRDRKLHPRVYRAPDKGRLEAWKEEMPLDVGLVVEGLLRREMARLGYEPWFTPRAGFLQRVRAASEVGARFLGERTRHYADRAAFYATNPASALWRARVASHRLKARWAGR